MSTNNPPQGQKQRAYAEYERALKTGMLQRGDTCSECGAPNPVGHHEDYSQPLDVMWLCTACHFRLHGKKRRLAMFERHRPYRIPIPDGGRGRRKDRTPMTTKRVAQTIGCPQAYIYRYAKEPDTKLVRAKVNGNAVLFETWSVEAEAWRVNGTKGGYGEEGQA